MTELSGEDAICFGGSNGEGRLETGQLIFGNEGGMGEITDLNVGEVTCDKLK